MDIRPAVVRACKEMAAAEGRDDYEAAEIVGSPSEYWLGDRRVSAATVNAMLRLCLLRSDQIGTEYEIHTLNEDGRGVAKDPQNYVPRILRPNAQGERQ